MFGGVIVLLLSMLCFRYTTKPVLITILLVSASAAYFMDTYNVIIDELMIDNILNTNAAEAVDLFSFGLLMYLLLLGVLPSIYIYKADVE